MENQNYLSLGYSVFFVFFVLIVMNAITLGTWSFSHQISSVPLIERILGMFHITKNAGLVEMAGQLLITCTLSNKYLIMTFKNKTETRKLKDVKWLKTDILCLMAGFILMFIGALIESNSILIG